MVARCRGGVEVGLRSSSGFCAVLLQLAVCACDLDAAEQACGVEQRCLVVEVWQLARPQQRRGRESYRVKGL